MKGLLALYLAAFAVSLTTLSLNTASTLQIAWIRTRTPAISPIQLTTTYGLFRVCEESSYEPGVTTCRPFPSRALDCEGQARGAEMQLDEHRGKSVWMSAAGLAGAKKMAQRVTRRKRFAESGWGLCENWSTAGYAHQLSLILGFANIIAIVLTLIGTASAGRGYRTDKLRTGWKLVAGLMFLQAVCMCISSSFIAWERHHDELFAHGSKLGRAWVETVVAYALNLFIVITLILTRITGKLRMVPGDNGYEPIAS
ncbi:hypothetical protein Rt10032_c10g4370 [Rhodotorula toruloides]|uniref:Actin cortical patch SUR7/pH-response regulator PalI n=1 Tax=Rhodotorula toruloides TaxID=5286 RepID=A0A511KIZ8_RHOTO|nr:hypothetical protein Rt10032_c10g4370 [Rhodotorula toruloides]